MLGHLIRPLRRMASVVGVLGGRSTWSYPGRVHLELLREHVPETEIETRMQAVPGVRWARVNVPLGRVIVALDDPPPDRAELMKALDEAEAAVLEKSEAVVPDEPPPGLVLTADAAGLLATALEWLIRRTPLPAEAAGLVGLVDNLPRLREVINDAIPTHPLKRWLPVAGAAVQGLAPGVIGLAVDMAERLVQLRERHAEELAWRTAEELLTGTPERAAAAEIPVERPVPLRPGPAERYADQLLSGAPLGGLVGALLSMNARRGLQTAMVCTPKAAFMGRETFAAELGIMLSRRGVLVVDWHALRLLDRVDTVVLEEEMLLSPRGVVGEKRASAETSRRRSADAEAAIAAVRKAGLRLVVRSGVDARQVRRLQAEGAGVLVVSPDGRALAQADCGAAVLPSPSGGPAVMSSRDPARADVAPEAIPWGAHVMFTDALRPLVALVAAVVAARQVAVDGVRLARVGTGAGALLALTAPNARGAAHALAAVNVATGLSMGQGAWRAWRAARTHV
jgi:hypothetical protein